MPLWTILFKGEWIQQQLLSYFCLFEKPSHIGFHEHHFVSTSWLLYVLLVSERVCRMLQMPTSILMNLCCHACLLKKERKNSTANSCFDLFWSRFGTWPVAMLAQSKNKAILEGPVCNGTQVIGWHTNEKSKRLRRFHVDMSGFAFNSTILWDPKRWHRPTYVPIRQLDTVKEGFQVRVISSHLFESFAISS